MRADGNRETGGRARAARRGGRPAAVHGTAVLAAACVLGLTAGSGCAQGGGGGPEAPSEGRLEASAHERRGDVAAVERQDLESVFAEAGVEGTFVLHDTRARESTLVGAEAAYERAVPASTFKLANTLIGLETGAVSGLDEVLPHGGGPQPVEAWEQDMSLREAFPASNFPVYQELARRVGHERMAAWVDRFDYGNRDIGGEDVEDRFWLDGPLEVSAVEQTEFLASLARSELPVDAAHQEALREIALVEEGDGHALFAKSGWAVDVDPAPGWWVGWVERGEDLYTFALRIEMDDDANAELREPLARELLVELGALPGGAAGD
ncbi:hypothetical protein GCM10009551_017670 [Nocardiopsis tropica]